MESRKKNTVETEQDRQHAFFLRFASEHKNDPPPPPSRAVQSMDYRMISQAGFAPRARPIDVEDAPVPSIPEKRLSLPRFSQRSVQSSELTDGRPMTDSFSLLYQPG